MRFWWSFVVRRLTKFYLFTGNRNPAYSIVFYFGFTVISTEGLQQHVLQLYFANIKACLLLCKVLRLFPYFNLRWYNSLDLPSSWHTYFTCWVCTLLRKGFPHNKYSHNWFSLSQGFGFVSITFTPFFDLSWLCHRAASLFMRFSS